MEDIFVDASSDFTTDMVTDNPIQRHDTQVVPNIEAVDSNTTAAVKRYTAQCLEEQKEKQRSFKLLYKKPDGLAAKSISNKTSKVNGAKRNSKETKIPMKKKQLTTNETKETRKPLNVDRLEKPKAKSLAKVSKK